jgi:hexosaminidase
MPWPKSIETGSEQFVVATDFTVLVAPKSSERTRIATTKFLRRLSGRSGIFIDEGFSLQTAPEGKPSLLIAYDRIGELGINQDESYQIYITTDQIKIQATTDIGVIYGLETLLQLLRFNEHYFYFPETIIYDEPRFTWRGLMIDAARHFQPVDVIKRNLDAMAAVKLNVLHWHLTDDQGFRVESKTHPKLHELASDGEYYTQNQIKDIVKYASAIGIRVVPEFDVPGHATAILTAYPEIGSKEMTYELERFAGIFDPTIDPTNELSYKILGELFAEMTQLFPDKYFHIGGDENAGKHWNENEKIQEFKKKHNLETNHDLQTYFNIRLEKMLAKHGKSIMGWEEIMTKNMPNTALIHSWKGVNEGVPPGKSLAVAAQRGYNTVLSNGYYIDLLQPVREHYLVDPMPKGFDLTNEEKSRILGGEATMWGELVTPLTIDSRIWPRTAAIAERFWSPESIRDLNSMYERLEVVSHQLEELGITHIRNRDVILRNISKNQDIKALINLTRVYEPLKIYTRNAGGTEYKSFSPFTLFADACTADATDGRSFNELTDSFLKTTDPVAKKELLGYFKKWSKLGNQFNSLHQNPLLKSIRPLAANLATFSTEMSIVMEANDVSADQIDQLNTLVNIMKTPVEDVELTVLFSFRDLIRYYTKLHQLE